MDSSPDINVPWGKLKRTSLRVFLPGVGGEPWKESKDVPTQDGGLAGVRIMGLERLYIFWDKNISLKRDIVLEKNHAP